MKKILGSLLIMLVGATAIALPVGNPADPILLSEGIYWNECYDEYYDPYDPCNFNWNAFSLRFGYYGDFVFNRDLQRHNQSFEKRIDHLDINTNSGLLVLNLWDRINIFGTLGGTKFNFNTRLDSVTIGGRLEGETDTDFSWSIGARAILFECGCTVIGVEGQYFRATPNLRRATINSSISVFPDDNLEFRYREWQVGLGIAHRINILVPYFAVKWSGVDADINGSVLIPNVTLLPFPDFRERAHWGYAFGVSLVDCDIMSLNVEARLRDEKAVAVNAQIRF